VQGIENCVVNTFTKTSGSKTSPYWHFDNKILKTYKQKQIYSKVEWVPQIFVGGSRYEKSYSAGDLLKEVCIATNYQGMDCEIFVSGLAYKSLYGWGYFSILSIGVGLIFISMYFFCSRAALEDIKSRQKAISMELERQVSETRGEGSFFDKAL
jgi:hypothetical protein